MKKQKEAKEIFSINPKDVSHQDISHCPLRHSLLQGQTGVSQALQTLSPMLLNKPEVYDFP